MKIPKKITLSLFDKWMKENLNCELRQSGNKVKAIINADVIEKGSFAALFAQMVGSELMICELLERFHSPKEAWAALESGQDNVYDLVPFHQWVKDQYWTAKEVKVEVFSF